MQKSVSPAVVVIAIVVLVVVIGAIWWFTMGRSPDRSDEVDPEQDTGTEAPPPGEAMPVAAPTSQPQGPVPYSESE